PLQEDPEASAVVAATESPEPLAQIAPAAAAAPPRLVLIAEDDSDLREVLATVIGAEGYEVVVVRDGREAIEILLNGPRPSVIIIDLIMPVMDGWQLCEELSNHPELGPIPVIVMSGSSGPLVP